MCLRQQIFGNGSLIMIIEINLIGEDYPMKLAVCYDPETGDIFQHFGQTPAFKVYEVEDNKIVSSEVVDTGDNSHAMLVVFLSELGANALISGGIGMGAKNRLEAAGIRLFGGAKGNADEAAQACIDGTLQYDPLAAEHHGPCSCHH